MKYFIHTALLLLLAGCRGGFSDPSDSPVGDERTIVFRVTTTDAFSKAVPVDGNPLLMADMGVYCYNTLDKTFEELAPDYTYAYPNKMCNTKVEHQIAYDEQGTITSRYWSYEGASIWFSEDRCNYSFFAYSPYASAANGITPLLASPGTAGAPSIRYETPEQSTNQPDLMIARRTNLPSTVDPVDLSFSHALACVGFRAKGQGEQVLGVKISGVRWSGTLSLVTGEWSFDQTDEQRDLMAAVNSQPFLDANYTPIITEDGYMMVIPQMLSDEATITLILNYGVFEANSQNDVVEFPVPLKSLAVKEWEAGKKYEYQFDVDKQYDVLLSPSVVLLPSTDHATTSFVVLCDPDYPWTINYPSGSWFTITDDLLGQNVLPSPISGVGPRTLYAHSETANTAEQREAIAVYYGTSSGDGVDNRYITVRQLPEEQYYYPSAEEGWAGSNIYWDAAYRNPDGSLGRLTFDDVGVRTHERYQGVQFMWGSLVALSPVGNLTVPGKPYGNINPETGEAGPDFNGIDNRFVSDLNELIVHDSRGVDPSSYADWTEIPRAGWDRASDLPEYLQDDQVLYRQRSYLYKIHDPAKGIGDICKYITDKGWAPGADMGVKWRMPTSEEFEPATYYVWQGGSPGPFVSNKRDGTTVVNRGVVRLRSVFFPASGCRSSFFYGRLWEVGSMGYYWPSSPYMYGSYYLLGQVSGVVPFHFYWEHGHPVDEVYPLDFEGKPLLRRTSNRPDTYNVRCVREGAPISNTSSPGKASRSFAKRL